MIIITLILAALVLFTAWDSSEAQVAPVREPATETQNSCKPRG